MMEEAYIPLPPEFDQGSSLTRDDELVPLNAAELENISRCAYARHVPKEQAGIVDLCGYGSKSGFERHQLGVMTEYAVSKYLHVPMDWSTCLSGDRHGPDLIVGAEACGRGPWKIEVKSTSYAPPLLVFNSPGHFRSHLAVLAMKEGCDMVRLYGWTTRIAFLECCRKKDLGYGERLVLEAAKLRHMVLLKARLYDLRFATVALTSESRADALRNQDQ